MTTKTEIQHLSEFTPGIAGYETTFEFLKAQLDKDFIWKLFLKFDTLPEKISMNYKVHFYLNPEPTQSSIMSEKRRLDKKQMEL